MIRYLELKNFRCFDELKINNTDRINLIAGENNVGKSALLEAISQCSNISNPNSPLMYDSFRGKHDKIPKQGPSIEPPWTNLFRNFDLSSLITLAFEHTITGKNKLTIRDINDPQEIVKIILLQANSITPEKRNITNIAELVLDNFEKGKNNDYILRVDDIIDWIELLSKMTTHKGSFEKIVWESLSNECRENIKKLASDTMPADDLKSEIVNKLNEIINGRAFYEDAQKSNFQLITESGKHGESETQRYEPKASRRLNRTILEMTFPKSIARHSIDFHWVFDGETLYNLPSQPPFTFPSYFLASRIREPGEVLADIYGRFEINGRQEEIIESLKIIEPRLRNLKIIPIRKEYLVHGILDGVKRPIPLYLMGDGIVRLMEFIQIISLEKDRVILIDEIENGLHHSILKKVWKAIAQAARRNNAQVFATTHSYECIRAAHRAFSEEETYDFRLHRLERVKGKIKAITYSKESLEAALEMDLEVR